MPDIAHYMRPAHLPQLRKIILPCFEENPAPDAPFVSFLTECEAEVLQGGAFAEGSGGLVGLLIGGGLTHPHLE
jgi:hypothetical protein